MDTMKKGNIIEVNNLSKEFKIGTEHRDTLKSVFLNIFKRNTYKRFKALDDVSFSVKQGEFFGIIGRNGSGKSTLLKIIAGIYLPDRGSVKYNGRIVPFLELGVGFNPDLTARENIFLNGTILGLTRAEIRRKFDEIVDFAEIRDFLDTPVKNFSSGMYVRLAFSIAIQVDADIYILDEVLAVGDVGFQKKCFRRLDELQKKKATIIFVSHDVETVQKQCDRVLLLEHGKVDTIGPPKEVVKRYRKKIFG